MIKTCLLINSDPKDQLIFMEAMAAVAPTTFFMLASDGQEAIEVLCDDGLVPDYAFVELNMPGIDGLSFLRQVKAIDALKDMPVILHSANLDPNRISELIESGAHALYSKPYNYVGVCNVLNLYFKEFTVNLN